MVLSDMPPEATQAPNGEMAVVLLTILVFAFYVFLAGLLLGPPRGEA